MRRPELVHRSLLVLLALASTLLLALSILGVPIAKSIFLYSAVLSFNARAFGRTLDSDTFQAHLGVLGFCHGANFTECSAPGIPWHFVEDDIQRLRDVPGLGDAAQGIEDAFSGLVTGALVLFLIAGPVSLITLVHDLLRPAPGLGSWPSVVLSVASCLFSIAAYIASRIIFGAVGDAAKVVAALPGVTSETKTGSAAQMTLAAGIIWLVSAVYKLVVKRRLASSRRYDVEMRQVK